MSTEIEFKLYYENHKEYESEIMKKIREVSKKILAKRRK